MTSLASSSSVSVPVALAHSYNSSGRLGMFVNPHACSCVTCVDYVGAEHSAPVLDEAVPADRIWADGEWIAADSEKGLATAALFDAAWAAQGGRSGSGSGAGVALARAPANQFWTGSEWVPSDSVAAVSAPAPAPAALPGLGPCSAAEEEAMVRLSALRLTLMERQDAVYTEAYRSHDEADAQDAEWLELSNKIHAIETLLRAFGVVIRDA